MVARILIALAFCLSLLIGSAQDLYGMDDVMAYVYLDTITKEASYRYVDCDHSDVPYRVETEAKVTLFFCIVPIFAEVTERAMIASLETALISLEPRRDFVSRSVWRNHRENGLPFVMATWDSGDKYFNTLIYVNVEAGLTEIHAEYLK